MMVKRSPTVELVSIKELDIQGPTKSGLVRYIDLIMFVGSSGSTVSSDFDFQCSGGKLSEFSDVLHPGRLAGSHSPCVKKVNLKGATSLENIIITNSECCIKSGRAAFQIGDINNNRIPLGKG